MEGIQNKLQSLWEDADAKADEEETAGGGSGGGGGEGGGGAEGGGGEGDEAKSSGDSGRVLELNGRVLKLPVSGH